MKRKILVSAALAAVLIGTPAFAHEDGTEPARSPDSEQTKPATVTDGSSSRGETRRSEANEKKASLKERLEKRQAERKSKLEGRRLAQCQNREARINKLVAQSVATGRDRLAKIQTKEEAVKAFYAKHELSSGAYEAAVAAADEKEAVATATLDTLAGFTFDCDQVDGASPAEGLKDAHKTKHQALDDYRRSVKQLFAVVKDALVAKNKADSQTGGQE